MEDIGNRLKQLLDEKKLSQSEFAEQVGIQRSSLSHLFSGRNKPSIDLLLKIKKQFPETDLEWLITGGKSPLTESRLKKDSVLSEKSEKKDVTDVNNDSHIIDYESNTNIKKDNSLINEENAEIERIVIFYTGGQYKEYKSK